MAVHPAVRRLLNDPVLAESVDGYVNALTRLPDVSRVYGTESMYGDWDGEVLLLAKDFACWSFIEERLNDGDPDPYQHGPTLKSNRFLRRVVDPLRRHPDPRTCGFLYGSALVGLCRDDEKMSGGLPNRSAALGYGAKVLKLVMREMAHLRLVVCLGREAEECAWIAEHGTCDRYVRAKLGTLEPFGGVRRLVAHHPAARVSDDDKRASLKPLTDCSWRGS